MSLKGKRIFYIEDDLKNRAIVQMILEQQGVKFGFERWGRDETLPKLRDFAPIDLILLDLMFPQQVTGYDIYAAIREEAMFAQTPVVAVSASEPAIEVPRLQRLGFRGFIAKPINLHSFPRQLDAILGGEILWAVE